AANRTKLDKARYQLARAEGLEALAKAKNPKDPGLPNLRRQIAAYDGYHSVSLTGGEPLVQAEFLASFLPLMRQDRRKIYLETNGTLWREFSLVRDDVDIVAMDIKLPSSGGQKPCWLKVVEFLNRQNDFNWEWADLRTLWSAAQVTGEVAVGYKPLSVNDVDPIIHKINIHSAEWKAVHDALIERVLQQLNSTGTKTYTRDEIVAEDDPVLPLMILRVTDKTALTLLRNIENVRYLEPYGYWPQNMTMRSMSSSGCSSSTEPLNSADWTTITPGCRLPWNYNNMNIPTAWNTAEGQGIQIGVIDAGLSSSQALMGAQFNDGMSNVGRTVTVDYTRGNSAYTSCTHGTSMASTAAGPRNAQNATTGVAYKSSLHFIRSCDDVVLDASAELSGTKNALIRMGDMPGIRVISMSIGTPFGSGVLKDGVNYANGKGKLIFAAAGTSFSWTSWWGVIYPAAYSACVAVTGVKESGSTCATCHDGSQVRFTVPMERTANSNRNSLALMPNGTTPAYIGGSSVATSTAAGVAALVWSAKPTLTSAQVLDIMTRTAQFYPSRNSTKGFGNINAAAAVTLATTY
ncbi:MAG TPA: S8 family serine peptidase, partial [Bacteroidia bacterium]|nr:S8 family serine peptidase [Bacteroidia bacterium]